jgi:hypothetical protein
LTCEGRTGMAGVAAAHKMMDDQELMRRLLAHYTLKECAAIFNVTYHTICRRARRPEFLQELRDLSGDTWSEVDHELRATNGLITERIIEISEKALNTLELLMDNTETQPALQAKIAMDFLDRNPETTKTRKIESKVEHQFMNPRVLIDAAQAAREMDETQVTGMLEAS